MGTFGNGQSVLATTPQVSEKKSSLLCLECRGELGGHTIEGTRWGVGSGELWRDSKQRITVQWLPMVHLVGGEPSAGVGVLHQDPCGSEGLRIGQPGSTRLQGPLSVAGLRLKHAAGVARGPARTGRLLGYGDSL